MSNKPKIIIDVDDVMVKNMILVALNKFKHTDFKEEDFTEYFFTEEVLNEEEKREFVNYILANDIYEECILMEGAKEKIKILSEILDVYIASTCVLFGAERTCGVMFKRKFDMLMKYFPFIAPHKIILTSIKNCFSGFKYQIDDRLENLYSEDIKFKFLFTRYHNRHISDEILKEHNVVRVNDWQEILDKILKLEKNEGKDLLESI